MWLCAALMAVHWLSYFFALDSATVAIAILTLYCYPVVTTFLEPWLLGTKFRWQYVVLALLMLLGLGIMSADEAITSGEIRGIILGLVSAVAYAFRNIYIKRIDNTVDGTAIMFHQVWMMAVLIAPFLVFIEPRWNTHDLPYIFLLGLITTALGHTLFVVSLQRMSVARASLMSMLVPIYGVVLAYLFLSEVPTLMTMIGGGIILATAAITTLVKA